MKKVFIYFNYVSLVLTTIIILTMITINVTSIMVVYSWSTITRMVVLTLGKVLGMNAKNIYNYYIEKC